TREGGLGLGLSLSETLASGMGGSLSAANASPRGARFTLLLPLVAPNP
ncbi:ATP-binding protein, partial [Variovorax sp. Varisp62]